jgi:hypothetical protein
MIFVGDGVWQGYSEEEVAELEGRGAFSMSMRSRF